jgi:hypothetical protein
MIFGVVGKDLAKYFHAVMESSDQKNDKYKD